MSVGQNPQPGPKHSDDETPAVKDPAMTSPPTVDDIIAVLSAVIDPELGSDIVTLGMVPKVELHGRAAHVTVALTTMGCPLRAQIRDEVRGRVGQLREVDQVEIHWTELDQQAKARTMAIARKKIADSPPPTEISPRTKVVMVASGKGGVGKSSVTCNLAVAIAQMGFSVGVLDADIWGYSVPRMLGISGRLAGEKLADGDAAKIAPNQATIGEGQIKVVSMGFLVDQEEAALMWRGLILNRAVQHFLEDVAWGDLDYLFIDMPPGTGDIQMGLAKMLPRAEMLIVTTPAVAAQKVAARAATMGRNNYLKVAGVIENMSEFVAPDGTRHKIFGEGGGQRLADLIEAPLLGKIPIDTAVSSGGDDGRPTVLDGGAAAAELNRIATNLVTHVVPPVDIASCTVRLMESPVSINSAGTRKL